MPDEGSGIPQSDVNNEKFCSFVSHASDKIENFVEKTDPRKSFQVGQE